MTRLAPDRPASAEAPGRATRPVFGCMLFGGPLSGALIRDVRLANELSARGYEVHVWWVMDQRKAAPLRPEIRQHWLFHGMRYYYTARGSRAAELFGRTATRVFHEKNRLRVQQRRPRILQRAMEGLVERVCAGPEGDARLVRRFARQIEETGVTHMLPMLAILAPWVTAARKLVKHEVGYLVTFQGYELYANYARDVGLEKPLYERLVAAVDESNYPAIAVSEDYVQRVIEDIGVPPDSLRAIPPGVPPHFDFDPARAHAVLQKTDGFAQQYRPELPMISFLGRRDTEKGIDLLLYAATILRQKGLDFQLAICGPTLFGDHYSRVCQQLAVELRCPVIWRNYISSEVRSAVFCASRCIVYPSVHREPFGMVAVEALAHGTPSVVPDYGGIASAIEVGEAVGGLRFRAWDSGHLAEQIERLITDDDLHRRLSAAGPAIAEHFSVENLANRVLDHLQVPRCPPALQSTADKPE